MKKNDIQKFLDKKVTVSTQAGIEILGILKKSSKDPESYYCIGDRENISFKASDIDEIRISDFEGDFISRKRIKYELGYSNMPKKYTDFCLRVLDSESLTPTIKIEEITQKQRNLFKSIVKLSEKAKDINAMDGSIYKEIKLVLTDESIKEIEKWIKL